jgi:predicted HD superfamily hydrolase involved in NAD metabolism
MKKYAECYNIDKGKAYIAGLLHDLAKEFSSAEILKLSTKFKKRKICNIEYFDFKKKHAFLLHGAAAAEIMYTELKIKDPEILQAVVHHTLGGKNLSILSKFTFMADYCEPLRDYKLSKDIYNMLVKEKDFNKAYFYTYVYLIERILKKENYICLESIDGYNDALMYYKK